MLDAYHDVIHWLLYGTFYQFTSGPIIALGIATLYHKHQCHVHRCWRIARHPVEGTPYVVCRKHHPAGHLTAEKVLEDHLRGTT